MVLTFLLMFAIMGTAVDSRAPAGIAGWGIGMMVAADILMGGPLTGAAMNPARHLGTALFDGLVGDAWMYWVGPVVGAALGAMDAPLPFETIHLGFNDLTAAGMRSIAEGMGRGRLPNLRTVVVDHNPALGDGGAAALAEALADCANLELLHFSDCGVGGEGFAAVRVVSPSPFGH